MEEMGKGDIVGFFAHGRSFCFFKSNKFLYDVMSEYFKQGKLLSFQRQINLYGFTRITNEPDVGGYYHELFLRNGLTLSRLMRRQKNVKSPKTAKGGSSLLDCLDVEDVIIPNFYNMDPITTSEEAVARNKVGVSDCKHQMNSSAQYNPS